MQVGRTCGSVIGVLMMVAGLAGCRAPDAPSTPTAPSPAFSAGVQGDVIDSAYRPVPGARVEVMSGPRAGQSTIADSAGGYSFVGPFGVGTEFRATKSGYVTVVDALQQRCMNCANWLLSLVMDLSEAPVNIAGDYALTFEADGTCGLPSEVAKRTYSASIRPVMRPGGAASTAFNVTFPGTPFRDHYDDFQINVAGDYLAFKLDNEVGSWLIEQLSPTTYLSFGGTASALVGPPVSTIVMPFQGVIEFCEAGSPGERCSVVAVGLVRCASNYHRLIMERR